MRYLLMLSIAVLTSVTLPAAEIDEYVHSRADGTTTIQMNDFSTQVFSRLPKGHYFWFRDGNRSYVIRDGATLTAIQRLFDEANRLDPAQEALRRDMDRVERRESEIESQVDRIEDEIDAIQDSESPLSAADRDRLRGLRQRQRALETALRTVEAELRQLERKESELDRRSEELEREAERKLVPLVEDAIRRGVAVRGDLH